MTWYRNLRMTAKIILPVGLMLVVTLSALAWQIQSKSSAIIQSIAERELAFLAGKEGNAAKSLFEASLDATQALADSLKSSMEQGVPVSREQVIQMMQGVEKSNNAFMSAGSGWEPNAYDGRDAEYAGKPGHDAKGRFIPYSSRGVVEPLKDLEISDYYAEPKRRARTYLTKPYFYEIQGKNMLLSTASAAVVINNTFRGVVLIDLSLEDIAKIVSNLHIYTSGWGAILSQDGTIVADKDVSLVGKSMFDTGRVGRSAELRAAMRDGKPFMEQYAANGKESFFYYYPIPFAATGQTWYFVVSAPLDEVLAAVAEINTLTIGISALVLLLSMLVIFIVVRASVKPLGILAGVAKEIAQGNLRVPINDERFGGEVRELSTALKEMIASLIANISKAEAMSEDARTQTAKAEEAMREAEAARQAAERAKRDGMLAAADQLEGVVAIISAASEELSAQVEQSERGSSDQAARVSETATAMEEMNSTVLEVARNAASASEVSARTRAKAEEGSRVVQEAVSGIRNVQTVSLALKSDMATLDEQARSISQIMGVISDIADQTNLLALNAAIEAARAGDAGRGFAVVADEVRKLAEKTMVSTTDVGKAIQSIQQSVKQSITQVERAVELIDIATEQSNKSGDALGEIVTMVDNAADQVRAIATASEQQSSTSEEINRSIGDINDIAEQTARAMRESAKAVTDLAAQTQSLSRLIDDMKRG